MFPVHAWVRWRLVGMRVGEFMDTLMPYVWGSLAAAAVCVAGRLAPWPSTAVELLVLAVAACAVYGGLLWYRARGRVDRILKLVRS
jgi:hypothetical protein